MGEWYGFDAFSPKEIAARVEAVGVAKARLPFLQVAMPGVLAGACIGLGALFFVIVASGACFSLGLLLVVVAGAELFTGNNLLAMAWADGRLSTRDVLWNWLVVCLANFVGGSVLVALVYHVIYRSPPPPAA